MKKYSERIPIPILQKTLQSVLLSGDGGKGGDLKEVIFIFVLFYGGTYCMLALLLIPIFDLYMILCSCQIIYLDNVSVITLSVDRRTSILHNWDLSTC